MTNLNLIYVLLIFGLSVIACEQSNKEKINNQHTKNTQAKIEKSNLEQALESALLDTNIHNVINEKTIIIKDSLTAINVAESILFSVYGKDNIIKQRPYRINCIKNHWIITGTLPRVYKGGTFLIIIDSKNSRIVRITHGK